MLLVYKMQLKQLKICKNKMEKLKTLKDIEQVSSADREWISKPQLKQEAIKWVKEENKQWQESLGERNNVPISPRSIMMMEFHNITEEDLK